MDAPHSEVKRQHRHSVLLVAFLAVAWIAVMALPGLAAAADPPLQVKQTVAVEYTSSGPHITYEITITNQGSEPLPGVLITDVLPAGGSLLYFSSDGRERWSSTQGETPEGMVAIWRSDAPLAAGESARLRYTIQAPPGTTTVVKDAPRVRAEGYDEIVSVETVSVALTPAPTSTATTRPTAPASSPTAQALILSPTIVATVAPSPTAAATGTPPATVRVASTTSPVSPISTRAPATSSQSIPSIIFIGVAIVIGVAMLLLLVIRKR